MFSKIRLSLSRINRKLFFALLILGLAPTVYTTLRVFFLGQLPGEWSYSIAGQLSWVNLFYEVLNEAIILPLFFFMGRAKDDKAEFTNRIRTGMLLCLGVYAVLSGLVAVFAEQLLAFMATDVTIIAASATYIRIECVAHIFAVLAQFALVALVTVDKSRYLYILTALRLVISLVMDTFLVSAFPFSLQLGVNGIGYSNIVINGLLLFLSVAFLQKEGVRIFSAQKLRFGWAKDFAKVGGISGFESLVRNLAYMLMVARMVNMVGEQGTYWVANNFIWGWLLLPVLQLGELIKQEVATDHENVRSNTIGYFAITALITVLWLVTIPLWEPFMRNVLGYADTGKLMKLVLLLVGFYVFFAFQNVFDATFYGLGLTHYMLFESVVTNAVYYGGAFILYLTNVWTPSLEGIALLFGFGNVFDSVVSYVAYRHLLKKRGIRVLDIK